MEGTYSILWTSVPAFKNWALMFQCCVFDKIKPGKIFSFQMKNWRNCGFIFSKFFMPVSWAATWENKQSECASSEDSDPPSLIRVFAVRMKKPSVLSYPLSAQRRLWSNWANAQADLTLRWAHSHFLVLSCCGSFRLGTYLEMSSINRIAFNNACRWCELTLKLSICFVVRHFESWGDPFLFEFSVNWHS